jgi:hypothetical protein
MVRACASVRRGWSEQRDGTKKADSANYLLFLWRLAKNTRKNIQLNNYINN